MLEKKFVTKNFFLHRDELDTRLTFQQLEVSLVLSQNVPNLFSRKASNSRYSLFAMKRGLLEYSVARSEGKAHLGTADIE